MIYDKRNAYTILDHDVTHRKISIDLIQYSYAGVVYLYLLYCVMYSLCVPRAKKKIFTIVGHMSTLSYPCVTYVVVLILIPTWSSVSDLWEDLVALNRRWNEVGL